jgi:hypothetical protein
MDPKIMMEMMSQMGGKNGGKGGPSNLDAFGMKNMMEVME